MCRNLFFERTTAEERLQAALSALGRGMGVLVADDGDRENEGDMIFPASSLTESQMALMIREGSGIVCLCLTGEKAESLELDPMVTENTSAYGTAFTVSIEAAQGVSTGVSAADRVRTIQVATGRNAVPSDLRRPGHVFPLVARPGGVLERPGHTEAAIDLVKLAGLAPAAVLCELTNPDGSIARMPELEAFALLHNMPLLCVRDILDYRKGSFRIRAA